MYLFIMYSFSTGPVHWSLLLINRIFGIRRKKSVLPSNWESWLKRNVILFYFSLINVNYTKIGGRSFNIYRILFNNAMKRNRNIKGYRKSVDIVRFYGAFYTHINELEYKKDRNNKVWTFVLICYTSQYLYLSSMTFLFFFLVEN